MKSRVYITLTVVAMAFLTSATLSAQVMLRAHAHGSYWQHTELYGLGLGMGVEVPVGKFGLAVDYSFGYGTTNRYKDLDNLDEEGWITVFANEEPWSEDIGPHPSQSLGAKTDYAKQHHVALMLTRTYETKGGRELSFGLGPYAAVVQHFFTFTNVITEIDLFESNPRTFNYIPVSQRRFLFYGLHGEASAEVNIGGRSIFPYIAGAYGPKYGSYGTLGVRITTALRRK